MPQYPGFVGAAYTGQSYMADSERLINWYVEPPETRAAKATLYGTPGFSTLVSASEAPGRGMFAQDGRAFGAIGQTLYEISQIFALTSRGAIARDTNPAQMTSSGLAGDELMIVSGGRVYMFDLNTNVLAEITVPWNATFAATHCGFLNGRFLLLDPSTSTFGISALLDGTTWSATDVAQRSDAPDKWVALGTAPNEKTIWLWGTETTSVYYDTGASPFPFVPVPNVLVNQGIAAPFTAARVTTKGGDAWMWLAQNRQGNRTVVMSNGYTAVKVSTFAVDFALQGYTNFTDAFADSYQFNGHHIYELTFPSEDATWCFDVTTGLWFERGYWNTTSATWEATRAQFRCHAFNTHLALNRNTGDVHKEATTLYLDVGGAALRRVRRAPHLRDLQSLNRIFYILFQLEMNVGVGLATGQGSDPQVMLRMSADGGKTFGTERWASVGVIGNYGTLVRWEPLGLAARDAVFEITVSDPVPFEITDAYINYTVGNF